MSGAGGGASMGGVFVVQAERTKRKPARREYKPTSRRQPLMKPPSEIHSRRIANPVTAPQDASHFLSCQTLGRHRGGFSPARLEPSIPAKSLAASATLSLWRA